MQSVVPKKMRYLACCWRDKKKKLKGNNGLVGLADNSWLTFWLLDNCEQPNIFALLFIQINMNSRQVNGCSSICLWHMQVLQIYSYTYLQNHWINLQISRNFTSSFTVKSHTKCNANANHWITRFPLFPNLSWLSPKACFWSNNSVQRRNLRLHHSYRCSLDSIYLSWYFSPPITTLCLPSENVH